MKRFAMKFPTNRGINQQREIKRISRQAAVRNEKNRVPRGRNGYLELPVALLIITQQLRLIGAAVKIVNREFSRVTRVAGFRWIPRAASTLLGKTIAIGGLSPQTVSRVSTSRGSGSRKFPDTRMISLVFVIRRLFRHARAKRTARNTEHAEMIGGMTEKNAAATARLTGYGSD